MLKAVAPNPDSRYQSVATFAADLRAVSSALELDEPDETDASAAVDDRRQRRIDDDRHHSCGRRHPVVGYAVVMMSPSWVTNAERAST